MKKFHLLFCGLLIGTLAVAQDSNPINTDRPTQSASAFVLPKGNFQVEYGFIREEFTSDVIATTYFNGLFRYGLFEGAELRLTQNILQNKFLDSKTSGLSPLTLGTKVHLVEERGALPQMSIIGQVTLETGEEGFQPDSPITEFRLNFQNTLSDKVSLGYNIGYTDQDVDFLYSIVLGYAFADGWSAFVEPYGFLANPFNDHRFNLGVIFQPADNFQFDVSGGFGHSESILRSFVGFGAAIVF